MKNLYPSFSILVRGIHRGQLPISVLRDKTNLFFFGCTKEGISQTFKIYAPKMSKKMRNKILSRLTKLERNGQVQWRKVTEISERASFYRLVDLLKINLDSERELEYIRFGVGSNLPATKDFLKEFSPEVNYLWPQRNKGK